MSATQTHTFVAYVEDQPGVLNRVTSLFRRRGYNIVSLNVGRTHQEGVSRMTMVVEATDDSAGRIEANLYKMVNVLSVEDITDRHHSEEERERLIVELRDALTREKRLSGLLPICSSCKKIRDDHGYWNQLEVYIQDHSDASFTHSFCPDCARRLYPEIFAESSRSR